ncbi:MAG: SdiA-regulated domain-containing protein [Saprospiraceae bacterium]|nr:SdiA-regulated domain-containing protein [Saprospiraceae bacterium]
MAKCTGNAPIQDATTAQASAEERGIMASVSQSPNFPYDLNNPNAAFDLDISLREISGLTTTPKAENLAAVQDEKGQLFYINKKTGKVTPSVIFAEDGDFEGVEFVGDTLWVVKSKGRLFKLWNLDKTPYDRASFKIESLKKANIEGLGYDAKNNRLLLAQKGEKTDDATSRALFAFDLRNQTPSVSKAYDIGLSDFQAFLSDKKEKRYRHLIEDYITDPVTRGVEFGPSGVAIHPPTGNLYVLSSMNKTLVILSAEGKILEMVKLDKNRFPQPEGICFDADGTLYLSSEAKDDPKGKVFVFKQQR